MLKYCIEKNRKSFLSLLLVLSMAFAMFALPVTAFASESEGAGAKISFSDESIELNKKKSKQLSLNKNGMADDAVISWKSSNKKVASVSSSGKVKAKKVGTAKITATVKGTDIKATCKVKVVHTKTFRVRATGYCNCRRCSGPGHPRTASGRRPKQGRTLAVDRRKIPLGSKIIMKGKTYYAEDTGSAIRGNKIDVYFKSHGRARRYGVKRVTIKVYYKK